MCLCKQKWLFSSGCFARRAPQDSFCERIGRANCFHEVSSLVTAGLMECSLEHIVIFQVHSSRSGCSTFGSFLARSWKSSSIEISSNQMEHFERRAVPLILHGDGAAVTQQIGAGTKSCLFLSFRSLVGEVGQHFLMASCWTHIAVKGSTMHTSKSIFSILAKSFLEMQHEAGARSGGFFGLPVFTSGDLEYFNEFHQLPRWNANHPCSLCSVHKSKLMDWNSAQEVRPDEWRLPRSHTCPLFRMLMSPQAVSPDWMHSKLLGIDQRFLSSVCWLLIFEVGDLHASLDARLFQLLHEMKTYWHMQSIDYGFNNLTLGCSILMQSHLYFSF